MSVDWTHLPDVVWYTICEHLPQFSDILHLSHTNQHLYAFVESNSFWRHLIRVRFGSALLKRYCDDMFSNKNDCNQLCSSGSHLIEFEKQYQQLPATILRKGWNLIVTGAQNGNLSGFAAAKRAKFYLPKYAATLKMAMNEKTFREMTSEQNQAVLAKLIYVYLSTRIRLSFAYETYICCDPLQRTGLHRPQIENDRGSDCGSTAILNSSWLAAIRGEFQSVLPGRYAIICRMKLKLVRCEQQGEDDQFTGEFTCIPEFGIMSSLEWDQEWFDLHYVMNYDDGETSRWFEEHMGTITVYEFSKIFFGIRIWQIPYRKYSVMCDYIELKIIE